jgi:hypothetical protein
VSRSDLNDLIRFRLHAHGLLVHGSLGAPAQTIESVARHMLAVQAQDLGQAGWALGVRTGGASAAEVSTAFASGSVVRSWPMRGTLHIVPAPQLNWMLALTTPRMLARTAARRRQLEIDEATLGRACEVANSVLAGGRSMPRAGFMAALERAGIATTGQRGYHFIYHLAQTGTLVWGPPAGNQQALVLSDEWIKTHEQLDMDEALAAFLTGYLSGHGPATLADFAWWSGLTMAQAKLARAVASTALVETEVAGTGYLMTAERADAAPPLPASHVRALPGFDEYFLGYKDRKVVIDPAFESRIVPGGNGVFKPTIISRGRVIGTWHRAEASGTRAGSVQLVAEPFTAMTQREESAFRAAAKRYGRYSAPSSSTAMA